MPSDVSEDDCEADADGIMDPQESTITIKEREAGQTGKKSQQSRKWLLDHVLLPRLKEAGYNREQYVQVYSTAMKVLDDFQKNAHRMLLVKPASKETSTIQTIGYAETMRVGICYTPHLTHHKHRPSYRRHCKHCPQNQRHCKHRPQNQRGHNCPGSESHLQQRARAFQRSHGKRKTNR
eukprot:gb/GECG01003095.1/.p1 GENE.gb/GECG01003095.1/~~gb/GECG01003095.1/.p1  ORF type:complete len:179 (+),score=22.02 gb/GECG01003095.1/:1-537(+)